MFYSNHFGRINLWYLTVAKRPKNIDQPPTFQLMKSKNRAALPLHTNMLFVGYFLLKLYSCFVLPERSSSRSKTLCFETVSSFDKLDYFWTDKTGLLVKDSGASGEWGKSTATLNSSPSPLPLPTSWSHTGVRRLPILYPACASSQPSHGRVSHSATNFTSEVRESGHCGLSFPGFDYWLWTTLLTIDCQHLWPVWTIWQVSSSVQIGYLTELALT